MSDLRDAFVELAKDRGIYPPEDATITEIMSAMSTHDGLVYLTLGEDVDDERTATRGGQMRP